MLSGQESLRQEGANRPVLGTWQLKRIFDAETCF